MFTLSDQLFKNTDGLDLTFCWLQRMYKAHVQVVESVRTRGEKRTYKAHEQDIRTIRMYKVCTAKNAADLLQVVNFTGLLQLVNKLQQTCQFH